MLKLDHLAVAAETLEAGRAAVEDALGVTLQAGGRHPLFGTHNLLLGLEGGLYLEVIAIDPEAPAPERPRWFDLDRMSGGPHLRNWICRTDDLAKAAEMFPGAGDVLSLERGDLRWQMAVPPTGVLPYDNIFPALIQWQAGGHPAERLTPSGIRLSRLVVCHPEAAALSEELAPVLNDKRVMFEPAATPELWAQFDTPQGPRVL